MGLRPGPHACLLPPWWLTLGHCTAIGGRTRLGRWLAGPCPPCVANRPSVAHWQNHWGQATEPTMVRACPPSLVCMLHVPCQKLGPRHKAWAGGHSNTWRLVLAHTGPRPVGRFCATQLCCFGQPFRQQRAASWGPKKFQAFGATWVAYTCPPWLANAPPLPLAMPLASATQTPPGPGGSPASTRCRRHRCSRPRATAWAQRGAKVSHLGGRGCAPEVWAPAVATQRVHWHPTPQAWQNGLFAGAPWCPNGAVSCANSPRRPQKFHGPRHKPPGWQRKPQEGPRPRRGRPCGGTAPPPAALFWRRAPPTTRPQMALGPPWCCT